MRRKGSFNGSNKGNAMRIFASVLSCVVLLCSCSEDGSKSSVAVKQESKKEVVVLAGARGVPNIVKVSNGYSAYLSDDRRVPLVTYGCTPLVTTATEFTTTASETTTTITEPVVESIVSEVAVTEPVVSEVDMVEPVISEVDMVTEPTITEPAVTSETGVSVTEVTETVVEDTRVWLDVPNDAYGCNSNFKAYMSYRAVTCTSSPQYQLLNGDTAYTDTNTGIRMVGDRYCIAVGSYYSTQVGQKLDLELSTGVIIPCIVGDCKADYHTNSTNQFCLHNGSVAEFIIDYDIFDYINDGSGTVNFCTGTCGSFDGSIVRVGLVS